jgi:hypothetical protein
MRVAQKKKLLAFTLIQPQEFSGRRCHVYSVTSVCLENASANILLYREKMLESLVTDWMYVCRPMK